MYKSCKKKPHGYHWRIHREGGVRHPPPPEKREGGRKKEKGEKREKRGSVSASLLFIVTCKNVCLYSTDERGFPYITSETIIIIVLLDHIDPSSVQIV